MQIVLLLTLAILLRPPKLRTGIRGMDTGTGRGPFWTIDHALSTSRHLQRLPPCLRVSVVKFLFFASWSPSGFTMIFPSYRRSTESSFWNCCRHAAECDKYILKLDKN